MTKNEFFSILNQKLSILNAKERKDIIDEYTAHIEFRLQEGKTEEQAIADFGDINDLVAEILEAYHINTAASQSKNLEYYIKTVVDFINRATERLLSLSGSDISKIIVEFLLVLCVIFLLGIPFDIVNSTIQNTLYQIWPNSHSPLQVLFDLVFSIVKIAVGFLIIYSFIKNRLLSQQPQVQNNNTVSGNNSSQEHMAHFMPENNNFEINYDINTGKPLKHPKVKTKNGNGTDFVFNLVTVVLKVFLFITVWLPCAIITVTGIVCTVIACLLLAVKGIGFIGLCIIGIGCCIMGISFTAWLGEIIFGGKKIDA